MTRRRIDMIHEHLEQLAQLDVADHATVYEAIDGLLREELSDESTEDADE